jgi:hypothetical protein
VDDHPLVDQVNRNHRVKLRFLVAENEAYRRMILDAGYGNPQCDDRRTDARPIPRQVIVVSYGREITVRDVIKHAANVAGSVHEGAPRGEAQEEVARWAEELRVGGYPVGTRDLQAMGA